MHEKTKELSLKATIEDTLCSDKIDGLPGRWLKNPAAIKMAERKPSLFEAFSSALRMSKLVKIPYISFF